MSAPASFRLQAYCKLNLFLEITGRRQDGYHEIATVMESISLADELVMERAPAISVTTDRADVPGGPDNLVHRILVEAARAQGVEVPAAVALSKRLPPGSGLGAGSSDAAAALRGACALHGLAWPASALRAICAAAGSDIAFFVEGGVSLCTGRGELIQPVPARGVRHYVVALGAPPAPTREVYAALRLEGPRRDPAPIIAALAEGDGALPDSLVFNRLDQAAFSRFPALRETGAALSAAAGREARLSGSGSAFFFLAADARDAAALAARVRESTGFDARAARSVPRWSHLA